MTHDGVKRLMMVMTSAYPNFRPLDMSKTIAVWENLLNDYGDKEVAVALSAYIRSDTKGYAPSIGQIINVIHSNPDELSPMEAWRLVGNAIRNGYYGAEVEFSKLPEVVQRAVGSPGQLRAWATMDIDSLESVAQSNFLRVYRVEAERAKQAEKMPPDLKHLFQREKPQYTLPEPETEEERECIPLPQEIKNRLEM